TKRRLRTLKKRAPLYKRQHAESKLIRTYAQRFGEGVYGEMGREILAAMKLALATGKDQPVLIQRRKDMERLIREAPARERARKAEQAAYVFTAKDEKAYTNLIKIRRLYEGACDL